MLSLQDMPDELISHVISFLKTLAVKRLAQTFFKKFTYICLPVLAKRLNSRADNDSKMIALFGDVDLDNGIIKYVFNCHASVLGTYSALPTAPVERLRAFDYLNLKDDLHWLIPIGNDDVKTNSRAPIKGASNSVRSIVTAANMSDFKKTCQQLEIVLPNAFTKFMTDESLIHYFPPSNDFFFDFKAYPVSLVRMKSSQKVKWNGWEDSIDGFACKFAYNDKWVYQYNYITINS
jgi:hypothetical protein